MMAAAAWVEGKSDSVSRLPPTTLYGLSSPATPESVRAEITRLIDAGEAIEPIAVATKIRAAKDEERRKNKQRRLSHKEQAAVAGREARRRRRIEKENAEHHEHQERRRQAGVDLADLLVREVQDQKLLVELLNLADPALHYLVQQRLSADPTEHGVCLPSDNDASASLVPQCRGTKHPIETAAATPEGSCSPLMAAFQTTPAEHRPQGARLGSPRLQAGGARA